MDVKEHMPEHLSQAREMVKEILSKSTKQQIEMVHSIYDCVREDIVEEMSQAEALAKDLARLINEYDRAPTHCCSPG